MICKTLTEHSTNLLATSHLRYLDTVREQLENRLKAAEAEVHRLRNVNEALMLNTTRHAMGSNAAPAPF